MTCATSGPFVGMTTQQLQAALGAAQQAYTELLTGRRGVTFSYDQGSGNKSVTYQATSPEQLSMFIAQLQRALGIGGRRRPLRMLYR